MAAKTMHSRSAMLVPHDGESNANIAMNAPSIITTNVNRYFNKRVIIGRYLFCLWQR